MPLDEAERFTQALRNHLQDRLISVVLFGSVARGEERKDSDIDLLVVIEGLPAGRLARRALLDPVFEQGTFAPGINGHLRTPKEAQKISLFYYDFPTDAKILFDTKDFFKKIIQEVASHIRKSGAVRKRWGKFYYWDLKPGAHAEETFDIL